MIIDVKDPFMMPEPITRKKIPTTFVENKIKTFQVKNVLWGVFYVVNIFFSYLASLIIMENLQFKYRCWEECALLPKYYYGIMPLLILVNIIVPFKLQRTLPWAIFTNILLGVIFTLSIISKTWMGSS